LHYSNVPQICDFGLAKWKQQAATQTTTGRRRGTVAYMAPEVFRDLHMPRTVKYDVYSFGILLWEILAEKKPFDNGKLIHLDNINPRNKQKKNKQLHFMYFICFYFVNKFATLHILHELLFVSNGRLLFVVLSDPYSSLTVKSGLLLILQCMLVN